VLLHDFLALQLNLWTILYSQRRLLGLSARSLQHQLATSVLPKRLRSASASHLYDNLHRKNRKLSNQLQRHQKVQARNKNLYRRPNHAKRLATLLQFLCPKPPYMPNSKPNPNPELSDGLYRLDHPDSDIFLPRPIRTSSVATLGDYIQHLREVDNQSNQCDKPCIACQPSESNKPVATPVSPTVTSTVTAPTAPDVQNSVVTPTISTTSQTKSTASETPTPKETPKFGIKTIPLALSLELFSKPFVQPNAFPDLNIGQELPNDIKMLQQTYMDLITNGSLFNPDQSDKLRSIAADAVELEQ